MLTLRLLLACTDPELVRRNEELEAEVVGLRKDLEAARAEAEAAKSAQAAALAEAESLRRRYSPSGRRCEEGSLPAAALESFTAAGLRVEARTMPQGEGLLLTGLKPDSLLVTCGLANADVLERIDGRPWAEWSPTLGQKELRLELSRKGKPLELSLKVR